LKFVILRLGLAAPAYYNALLGVGSAFYVLGLIAVYNSYGKPKPSDPSA
jgi:hypothetical protein